MKLFPIKALQQFIVTGFNKGTFEVHMHADIQYKICFLSQVTDECNLANVGRIPSAFACTHRSYCRIYQSGLVDSYKAC